jgi:chorismate synthase
MMVDNLNVKSEAYESLADTPRPGHADYPAGVKYGRFNDPRGGGRFSGRITAGFVMAGSVAKAALATVGIEVFAHTIAIENVHAKNAELADARHAWKKNSLSCADPEAAARMAEAIARAAADGDSVGGVVECIALNVPTGLGEPVFDSVESAISHALYSIPAVKGVEFGAGFRLASMRGTASNDPYTMENDAVRTTKNDAGGVLGGISSGMPIVARVAIKPTPSISTTQDTVNMATRTDTSLSIKGRHDACIVPRAVVVVEAMMATSLCDLAIQAGALRKVIE